jgi:PIN domain nuclease of toxin-antitoxin system
MNALLDTHVLLWFLAGDKRLSPVVRKLFESQNNELHFSAVSAIEISLKYARRKLKLPEKPQELIPKVIAQLGLKPIFITVQNSLQLANLPLHHADPFDRLLIIQAKQEELPIITGDKQFRRYDVQIIW